MEVYEQMGSSSQHKSYAKKKKAPGMLILVPLHITRSYSGIKYMCDELTEAGVEVDVWTRLSVEHLKDAAGWRFPVHSFQAAWYHKIPPLRSIGRKIHELFICLTAKNAIMFVNDLSLPPVIAAKKLRPGLKLINYCPEVFTDEEFPERKKMVEAYRQILPEVNLVIDNEPHRALKRKEYFGYTKDILILPSTQPVSAVPETGAAKLEDLAGRKFPANTSVLLFAGSVHYSMSFEKIVAAVESVRAPVFLLAFCRGDADLIEKWRKLSEERLGKDGAAICGSVARDTLLSCLNQAHIGLVYYPYSDWPSVNQLYCEPTKAYEYIAAGLPVVTSANPSMVSLVEERGLGACAKDDSPEALAEAIRTVMSMNADNVRERAKQIFRDELCFEKQAPPVINRLVKELSGRESGT